MLSIVVPAYEEALNLGPLCTLVFKACNDANLKAEMVVIDDDSGQGSLDSMEVVRELKKKGICDSSSHSEEE